MTKDKMRQVLSKYLAYLLDYNGLSDPVKPMEFDADLYTRRAADIGDFFLTCHLAWMCERCLNCLIENDSPKAHVWLGYVQGELRALGHFTVADLRNHNRSNKE